MFAHPFSMAKEQFAFFIGRRAPGIQQLEILIQLGAVSRRRNRHRHRGLLETEAIALDR